MTEAIAHRGPDDEGYVLINHSQQVSKASYRSFSGDVSPNSVKARYPNISDTEYQTTGNLALSHRRFSIIDLSDGGHQPLLHDDGSCCIVFNGEIYNYLELREELIALGAKFKTTSDTEVLMKAYREWGTNCFTRFNGFWALALYDFERRKLILSRDHLGKKPLYWTRSAGSLYFASEIKSLLTIPSVADKTELNQDALFNWCVEGKRDLDYLTFFKGIKCLPAACWVEVQDDFPSGINYFWSVPENRMRENDISAVEAATLLRDTLDDAVRIRLRTDVPLAVELSGGLDSSSVVALATRHSPSKLTTYTIKFADPGCDEEPFARHLSKMYDIDYRVLHPEYNGFWNSITSFTHHQEEPYHSPNLSTSQMIWSNMRTQGTKVFLSGAAGDELFGGYSKYFGKAQMDNLRSGHLRGYLRNQKNWTEKGAHSHPLLHEIALGLGVKRLLKRIRRTNPALSKHYLSPSVKPTKRYRTPFLSSWLREEIVNSQIPYWLRSGEKSTMGMPIESRCPMLDYRVVEVAATSPTGYLIRDGWHKWILRKAMEDLLPAEIVWRKTKMGFPFPFDQFLADHEPIISLILRHARSTSELRSDKIEQIKHDWNALSFVLWNEYFIKNNKALFTEIEQLAAAQVVKPEFDYTPAFQFSPR